MEILGLVEVPSWILLGLAVGLLVYYLIPDKKLKKLGYPGPEGWPVVGDMFRFQKLGMVDYLKMIMKEHGKVVGIDGKSSFLTGIFVTDFDMLRDILVKQSQYFQDRTVIEVFQIKPFDKGLTQVEGEQWRRLRSTLSPTFSTGKLKNLQGILMNCVNKLMGNLKQKSQKNEKFDVKSMFGAYTMDVIASTAFGLDLDTQKDPNNEFIKQALKIENLSFSDIRIILAMLAPKMFGWILKYSGPLQESGKFFSKTVERIIAERERNPGDYKDFLQLMVNAHTLEDDFEDDNEATTAQNGTEQNDTRKPRKKALTEEEMVGNAVLFFIAGYSTTMSTLSFLCYNLATNPEIQEKVITEIDQVLDDGSDPTYDNINHMPYLSQCMDETLRMYPIGFVFDRVASEDVTVKGWKIPKGTTISVPAIAIHYDPEIYPDPDKFDPDRFTPEAKAARNQFAYMPFGMGPRNCIGMRLAMMEIKMAMAKVLQNYRFVPCEDTQIPLVFSKSKPMIPETPLMLKVVARH